MSNKLQELTDRLYNEGLSKGREEGERILEEARAQAERTVADAKAEAEKILQDARNAADALRKKAESDVKAASDQCIQATKKDIENLLVGKISEPGINASLGDAEFLKSLIKEVAAKFSDETSDLRLILPASIQDRLEPWAGGELAASLKSGVSAEFSKKVSGGFKIGPAEQGWLVDFTDASFKELIAEYLRPVTRKLLFGE